MVAVGWQMYDLTHSAWSLGLVGLFQFVPALALALVSGHVADRYDRRHIVSMAMSLQLAAALVLLLSTHEGWISRDLILGVSLLLGVARSFQMTAQQALTPLLVPAAILSRAMAFSSSGNQAAIIGGPALGGFLYAAGASVVYVVCAALFVLGASLVWSARYDHKPAPRAPVTMDTLLAGVRFIRAKPVVLGAISLDLFAVLLGGADGAAADLRARHPARRPRRPGPAARRAGDGRAADVAGAGALDDPQPRRHDPVLVRGGVRRHDDRVRRLALVLAVDGGAVRQRRGRHGQRGGAPDAGAARHARRDARPRQRRQRDLHRRQQPARRVRVGRDGGAARPVGAVVLGGAGTLVVVGLWMRWFPELRRRRSLTEA